MSNTTAPAPKYLTYAEATAEFGVSQVTLRRLAAAGHLTRHRAVLDGRQVLLPRAELERELGPDAPRMPRA